VVTRRTEVEWPDYYETPAQAAQHSAPARYYSASSGRSYQRSSRLDVQPSVQPSRSGTTDNGRQLQTAPAAPRPDDQRAEITFQP
jgi:hypothetical protein